jgi:hypothetical protein
MDANDVILNMKDAREGNRKLDSQIAELLGWTVNSYISADGTRQYLWKKPSGEEAKVPFYTTSVQASYDLAQEIAPSNTGAFSWDDKGATATIEPGGKPVRAATPALAVCIAALALHQQ